MSSYLAFFSNIPLFSCYSKYLERKEIDLKYGFYHALMWLKGQLPGISSHNPSQSDSSMLNLIENEESKENTGTKSTDVLSFPVVGFSNIGNSCYMNSALQCLLNIPELVNITFQSQNNQGSLTAAVANLILEAMNTKEDSLSYMIMENFKNNWTKFDSEFSEYDQKDSGNALLSIISQLQDEAFENSANKEVEIPIIKLFEFQKSNGFKCKSCNSEKTCPPEILNLLVLPSSESHLDKCLEEFMTIDLHSCQKKNKTTLFSRFLKMGDVLIIKLERISKGKKMTKSSKGVEIPFQIDLDRYKPQSGREINSIYSLLEPSAKYSLISMIIHNGTVNSGHYEAYNFVLIIILIRIVNNSIDQQWYNISDDKVRQLKKKDVVKIAKEGTKPIILFYKRNQSN